ncbi:MAG: HNH endonuclease signature motif containing protein, partial [Clostridia bacterium]|nr:HNH endonuclease signature motif containing protein [Clostridia bacterium]
MDLNRETAMRLWNKSFGKETKVKDFTGRMMAKGAYNDRNSKYGWNVDHILPQSKGGTTADHNLICCHIVTNDEKADKFPCFTSNGIAFEIIKVQNHYEIRTKVHNQKNKDETDEVDFYDSAAGVRLIESLKNAQNKSRFVGTVFIYLRDISNNAVVDFIEKIFDTENISYGNRNSLVGLYGNYFRITVTDYDMPAKSDTSELLDKCVLLNTYLSSYFLECNYINGFDIYYR